MSLSNEPADERTLGSEHHAVAIIHNIPVPTKHLLFRDLYAQGLDFKVVFSASDSDVRIEKPKGEEAEYPFSIGYQGAMEGAPRWSRVAFAWKELQKIRPRVLIISGYYAVECWSAWLWALLHRVPMAMWFESNEFDYARNFFKELPKRLFVSQLDVAHVYGKSNAAYLHKLGMPWRKLVTKKSVVNTEIFSAAKITRGQAGSARNERIVCYVGRFAGEKNLAFLIKAFSKARLMPSRYDLRLWLVGYGPLQKQLGELVAALNLGDLVTFCGPRMQRELPETLAQCDAFVLPSTREPWGLVTNEAMLCRLPVLVSTQCGCAADLATPETGWTFSPFKEEELIDALGHVANATPEDLKRMGDAAHDVALLHSPAESAKRIIASLSSLRPGLVKSNRSVQFQTEEIMK